MAWAMEQIERATHKGESIAQAKRCGWWFVSDMVDKYRKKDHANHFQAPTKSFTT